MSLQAYKLLFREIICVYSEIHEKHIIRPTLCRQNVEFMNVERSSGTYSYHCVLKS
jgi:hypothetical protein